MSSNSINLCPFFTSKFGIIVAGGDHVSLGKNSYGKCTSINKLHRSNRSKLDSSAWFRFIDKDSPEYQLIKNGRSFEYSERQKKILSEEIPLEQVRLNELSRLANKAKTFGDMETYNTAMMLREEKLYPDNYHSELTTEEAKAVLDELTPWKIDW